VTSPDRSSSSPSRRVAPYLEEFDDLLRVVELAGGFVLQPVEVPGPDLANALASFLVERGHPVLVKEPRDDTEWEEVRGWLLDAARPPPEGVTMVIGSRDPPDGVYSALRFVNEKRDAIAPYLACPLLWCGPASFLKLTAERAPDFWSVRAVERRLKGAPVPQEKERPSVDLAEEARRQGDVRSTARLSLKAARERLSAGDLGEAEAVLRKVPEAIEDEDPALYAEIALVRAEVWRRHGQSKRAFELLDSLNRRRLEPRLECYVQLSLGRIHEAEGAVGEAEKAYDKADDAARRAGDFELTMLVRVRRRARELGHDPDHALTMLESSRQNAQVIGDLALEAVVTAMMATATARLHDHTRAQERLRQARELANRARGAPSVLLGGEVQEALEAAERALSGDDEAPRPGSRRPEQGTSSERPNIRGVRSLFARWPGALGLGLGAAIVGMISLVVASMNEHNGSGSGGSTSSSGAPIASSFLNAGVSHLDASDPPDAGVSDPDASDPEDAGFPSTNPSNHSAGWCLVDEKGRILCRSDRDTCEQLREQLGPATWCQPVSVPSQDARDR